MSGGSIVERAGEFWREEWVEREVVLRVVSLLLVVLVLLELRAGGAVMMMVLMLVLVVTAVGDVSFLLLCLDLSLLRLIGDGFAEGSISDCDLVFSLY